MDRKGPTALLNSLNRIDFTRIANGANLNLQFDLTLLKGERGASLLGTLLKTYFDRGGMQVQVTPSIPGSSWRRETTRANTRICWSAFPDIRPISTTWRRP